MLIPPLPLHEAERLRVLLDCGILDTDPEHCFDHLTALAAHICQAPISLITFVDEQRQWFKARFGLDVRETPRHIAFCAHAILHNGPFIVANALEDERFADNPLVTGDPHIRFYAGAPLVMSSGQVLGTLCVIDRVARIMHPDHRQALQVLCQHVVSQLELRLQTKELRRAHEEVLDLNQRLAKRSAELESANGELRSFAHTVAHDLRAPLRAISGFASILADDHGHELTVGAQQHLQRITQRAEHMGHMIDALLGLARLSRQTIVQSHVDATALVRELLADLDGEITARLIEVRLDTLPPCQGDRPLLRQVFANILDNAIKYTGRCVAPLITIVGIRDSDQVRYIITDNGIGFDMCYMDRLFTPFQRLHPDNEYSGFGIGLATVKRILDHHGGSISATAEVGQGAAFTVTLPAAG